MSSPYNATVTQSTLLSPGTLLLRVKLDGKPFAFEPGQYTVLGLLPASPRLPDAPPDARQRPVDHLIRRAYSITSGSRAEELEFVITLIPSGELTPRLFSLKPGARLFTDHQATGVFTLQTASGNRDLLLVATGSALAPYLSMIRGAFPQSSEHQAVILHAAAVSWDLTFRAQLETLAAADKHLTYIPVITEPEQDKSWHGLTGPLPQLLKSGEIEDLLGLPVTPERFDVYLSGSPEMIDEVTTTLAARGFQAGDPHDPATNIHAERYW